MQRLIPSLLAAGVVLAPLGAKAADLVVWWEKGFYPQEDEAVSETIAAFEQESGKHVEVVFQEDEEFPSKVLAALDAGKPPDFAFGILLYLYPAQWALENRLVDLSDAVGAFSDLFDPEALDRAEWRNAATGQKALYGLPIGRSTNLVHIWKSLLLRAGFTLEDIPREWDAFWSFWCDQVQPAVRKALGRDDVWGIGLPMSAEADDTRTQFFQFVAAYQADYVTRDGKLMIDDPEIRRRLVLAMDSYTGLYRKGCTPPGAATWGDIDNNKQFHAQTIVMTANDTLSIPNALKSERPDDYYKNSATIEWPLGPGGEAFPIMGYVFPAVVFKDGGNVVSAKEFVRFLVAEGWLMHYLDFSAERFLPPISKLLDQPFWLDPSDPHRMAAVMQIASRPLAHNYAVASGNWRHDLVEQQYLWQKAINRVITENISPEQAVDEAIARIKQILAE
jgi:multiple sugar transport system substrate-binding protein